MPLKLFTSELFSAVINHVTIETPVPQFEWDALKATYRDRDNLSHL